MENYEFSAGSEKKNGGIKRFRRRRCDTLSVAVKACLTYINGDSSFMEKHF